MIYDVGSFRVTPVGVGTAADNIALSCSVSLSSTYSSCSWLWAGLFDLNSGHSCL